MEALEIAYIQDANCKLEMSGLRLIGLQLNHIHRNLLELVSFKEPAPTRNVLTVVSRRTHIAMMGGVVTFSLITIRRTDDLY